MREVERGRREADSQMLRRQGELEGREGRRIRWAEAVRQFLLRDYFRNARPVRPLRSWYDSSQRMARKAFRA